MGLMKPDMYRFLALGFAAGALLIFGTVGIGGVSLGGDLVPAVHAEAVQ